MSDSEGRLGRWSQRKAAARLAPKSRGRAAPVAAAEPEPAPPAPETGGIGAPASAGEVQTDGAAPDADQEVRATEGDPDVVENLPDIEDLNKDSDFTPFMADGVPDELKNAALRKLWTSDPVFGFLDGMNEYDEDYNVIDRVITAVAEGKDKLKKGRKKLQKAADGAETGAQDEPAPEDEAEARTDTEKNAADGAGDDDTPLQDPESGRGGGSA